MRAFRVPYSIRSHRIGCEYELTCPGQNFLIFSLPGAFAYGRLIEINGTEYVECDVCINQTEVAKSGSSKHHPSPPRNWTSQRKQFLS